MTENFQLSTGAFENGMTIPEKYTCNGLDVSPSLTWSRAPADTRSLALIVDDPDAPGKTFVHWVLYNLPPDLDVLPENLEVQAHFEGRQPMPAEGANDFGGQGYGGPCPPPGDAPHHYSFRLYALDAVLDLAAGATKKQLTQAMNGHVLAESNIVGTFGRMRA